MQCPFCKKEMKKGYIKSSDYELKWFKKKSLINKLTRFGGEILKLSNTQLFKANRCISCKKVIIDYDKKK